MQKLDAIKISELSLPLFVCAIRYDIIGINEILTLNIDDVRCIIDSTDGCLTIKNNPKVRTSMYSAFRLAYKNEIKLCKS